MTLAKSGSQNPLGLTARSLTTNEKSERSLEHGLIVEAVDPESHAANAGLQPGDVLLELDGQAMQEPKDIDTALADVGDRGSVAARIDRDGNSRFIPIRVAS